MATEFDIKVRVKVDEGVDAGYMTHYVLLPKRVAAAFRKQSVKRVDGRLGMEPFRRALHEDGVRLNFGKQWLKDAGIEPGELLPLWIRADPDPDGVDLPFELDALLSDDPDAQAAWNALTPGKKRTLAYGVDRAKRPETRERRARELVATLLEE